MNKRLLLTFAFLLAGMLFLIQPTPKLQDLPFAEKYDATILLLPLDSRPPCTKFVTDLGKIANIKILLPPTEFLDCYKQPGNKEQLRSWLAENAECADAVIISADMLIHGGLWASRDSAGDQDDVAATLQLFEEIHEKRPELPLYVFNILPRLRLSDAPEHKKYQKDMLKYSSLKDQVNTFGDMEDTKELSELERKIPPAILRQYHALYQENTALNHTLIHLVEKGVFKQLIIGQDDGQEFGIPNIVKRRLLHELKQQDIPSERVTVTKGTDEVALTLLSAINGKRRNFHPKIFVQYSDDAAPNIVMPYMPNSTATTVREKIALVQGTIVDHPDEADFILFVHIGTEKNKDQRFYVNQDIQALLKQNYHVALVDLSEHFTADETVFPMLLNNGAPLNQLIAYSGWNTTSNAVGTAVAQAAIFTAGLQAASDTKEILNLYAHNLTFLSKRYLEDFFYLKQSIDTVNRELRANQADIYNLGEAYHVANKTMEAELNQKAYLLKRSKAYNLPIQITTADGEIAFKVSDLTLNAHFPWDRTFEIDLDTTIKLKKILEKPST